MARRFSEVEADEAPATVLDALMSDACDSQRARGMLPSVVDNAQFLKPILEQFDRKTADAKPAPPLPSRMPMTDEGLAREYYRRGGSVGSFSDWTVERGTPMKVEVNRVVTNARSWGETRITRRIRLLRCYPDWRARLMTVNPLATKGLLGAEKKREAELLYWRILRDSQRVFGPIFRDRVKPIYSLPRAQAVK